MSCRHRVYFLLVLAGFVFGLATSAPTVDNVSVAAPKRGDASNDTVDISSSERPIDGDIRSSESATESSSPSETVETQLRKDYAVYFDVKGYEVALAKCVSQGMTLATIDNQAEADRAYAATSILKLGTYYFYTAGVWYKKRWRWGKWGRRIGPYTNWHQGYPDRDVCLVLYQDEKDLTWISDRCSLEAGVLCQFYEPVKANNATADNDDTSEAPLDDTTPLPSEIVASTEHKKIAIFPNVTTFYVARKTCSKLNMTLATIESAEDANRIRSAVSILDSENTFYYTAGVYRDGEWQWTTSGQPIGPYTNWFAGMPDDDKCLLLSGDNDLEWTSNSCTSIANVVCEYMQEQDQQDEPTVVYARTIVKSNTESLSTKAASAIPLKKEYVVFPEMQSYYEALAKCGSHEMELATIQSEADSVRAQETILSAKAEIDFFYTAGVLRDNSWNWTTNDKAIGPYTNWHDTMPDGDKCLLLLLLQDQNVHWTSNPCTTAANVMCQYFTIAEDSNGTEVGTDVNRVGANGVHEKLVDDIIYETNSYQLVARSKAVTAELVKEYTVYDSVYTLEDALVRCTVNNMTLATIESDEDASRVRAAIPSHSQRWLYYTAAVYLDDTYKWLTNDKPIGPYENWAENATFNYCIRLSEFEDLQWVAYPCDKRAHVLCESWVEADTEAATEADTEAATEADTETATETASENNNEGESTTVDAVELSQNNVDVTTDSIWDNSSTPETTTE